MESNFNFANLRKYLEENLEGINIPQEAELGEVNFKYRNVPLGIKVDSSRRELTIFVSYCSSLRTSVMDEIIEVIKKWNGFDNKYEKWYKINKYCNCVTFKNAPNPRNSKCDGVIMF